MVDAQVVRGQRVVGQRVLWIADAGDRCLDVGLLRELTGEDIDLVVVGERREEVRAVEPGLAERAHAGAVTLDDERVHLFARALGSRGIAFDDGYVGFFAGEAATQVISDVSGADDEDAHMLFLRACRLPRRYNRAVEREILHESSRARNRVRPSLTSGEKRRMLACAAGPGWIPDARGGFPRSEPDANLDRILYPLRLLPPGFRSESRTRTRVPRRRNRPHQVERRRFRNPA